MSTKEPGTGAQTDGLLWAKGSLATRPVQLPILLSLLLGILYVVVSLASFLFTESPHALLVAASATPALLLLATQLHQCPSDLLAPLNFVALSVLFGTTLRCLYVVTVENRTTRDLLLLHEQPEFLFPAVVLINAAVGCMVLGYVVQWPRPPLVKTTLFRPDRWSSRRVAVVAGVLVVIGLVCILLYVDRLGIEFGSLGSLSAKRRVFVENARYGYASMGYHLWGMSLLSYAFFLLWTDLAFSRQRLLSSTGLTALLVGAVAAVPPLLTSSRTGLLVLLVYAALIWNYARRRLRARWLVGAVAAALVVVTVMGGLREMGGNRQAGEGLRLSAAAVPEAVLGNRNWLGVTKTAHVMRSVPAEVDYQKGKSLVTWMVAAIPRTVWPDKPVIRVGIMLGEEVFEKGRRTSGVPPGFIGELYLNFGYPGVLLGMLMLGAVLRLLYQGFWPHLGRSPSALLIYVVIVFPLAFTLVTTDVSGTAIEIGRSLITLAILLPLVRRRRSATVPAASGSP